MGLGPRDGGYCREKEVACNCSAGTAKMAWELGRKKPSGHDGERRLIRFHAGPNRGIPSAEHVG